MSLAMAVRKVVVAALGGGVLMFLCGAAAHVGLGLESRAMREMPGEESLRATLRTMPLTPGMYQYPSMAAWEGGDGDATARDQALAAEWKKGPSGILVVAPTGEEPMGPVQLGGEFASNCLAALLAAVALLLQGPATWTRRYAGLLLLAPVSWLTLTLSHGLWYRFPLTFTLDGLFVALLEWALAGAFMAWVLAAPRAAIGAASESATGT